MTPQELIETAQALNPKKLASRPAEALQDAFAYVEALRLIHTQAKPRITDRPDPADHSAGNDGSVMIERLRVFREQRKISVVKLAKLLNIHSGTLYFWLSGKYEPSSKSATKIGKFLEQHQ